MRDHAVSWYSHHRASLWLWCTLDRRTTLLSPNMTSWLTAEAFSFHSVWPEFIPEQFRSSFSFPSIFCLWSSSGSSFTMIAWPLPKQWAMSCIMTPGAICLRKSFLHVHEMFVCSGILKKNFLLKTKASEYLFPLYRNFPKLEFWS